MTDSSSDCALRIDVSLIASLTINVGARIEGIGERSMDHGISRSDPANLMAGTDGLHRADGQGTAQFAALRLVADPAVESSAKDVQFCFRHGAFQSEDQAIIKKHR